MTREDRTVAESPACRTYDGLHQNCHRGTIGCITDHPEMCHAPPPGWWCSRHPGHEGPCAARSAKPQKGDLVVPKDEPTYVCEVMTTFYDVGEGDHMHIRAVGTSRVQQARVHQVRVVKRGPNA